LNRHVGLIGLGLMGSAIGRKLLERGHAVTVWNRTTAKCDALQALGAQAAASPAVLAA
jgi:3-hydroxyisobutyrate dehydrogenase-like beta-hydroxyacid dehydrogenase